MEPLIIDVRENISGNCSPSNAVVDAIIDGLSKPPGMRSLPTLLLYNERGLRLYDDITTKVPEYYLFGCEEQILTDHADDIVNTMGAGRRDGEVVIELGAGALRKTSHFLLALACATKPAGADERPKTSYFALDLERPELVRTLGGLSTSIGHALTGRVSFGGMWGTYDGGIAFVKSGGLQEFQLNQTVSSKLSGLEIGRGRVTSRTPVVRTTQPTPTPSESNQSSPLNDDGLATVETLIIAEVASAPTRSALPTPPSSLVSPTSEHFAAAPIQILFLGSSIGNFNPDEAAEFLRALPLRAGSGDTLLLGLDQKNDPSLIRLAYDDPRGHTRAFAMNGLEHASAVTGGSIDSSKWSYVEKYNETLGRHEGYYRSNVKQTVKLPTSEARAGGDTVELGEGELVKFEYSYKYSDADAFTLFAAANLRVIRRWQDKKGIYSLWLLERSSFSFPVPAPTRSLDIPTTIDNGHALRMSTKFAEVFPSIPTCDEWAEMWKTWDTITIGMIPPEMLHQKPIDLRHKCLFYLGHIPAFLDIHLTRLLGEKHTEPEHFKNIFERGIDPHVDDPTQIHPHSEVPDRDEDWPALEEILSFRDRVRARLMRLYDNFESGDKLLTRKAGRVIWMAFEHEASHAETLLYMLIQRAGTGTIPPPTVVPNWEALAKVWDAEVSTTANSPAVVRIGPSDVTIGHEDFEAGDASAPQGWQSSYEFGWDNEHPARLVPIGAVDVSTRPITNGDYLIFLSEQSRVGEKDIPASWVHIAGKIHVRTLYGPITFDAAKHWPLAASYDEILAYARAQGGRLPTEAELLTFRDRYDSTCVGQGNFGYQNWHYVPPHPSTLEKRGHNGGIWEWTSTLMHAHEGYISSTLYPGYSSDFHDEKHHIVLGGSFATIPRIAMRRSYANFYQYNYPYAWIGGRLSNKIRLPAHLRLNVLQDARLSAISLPPRPTFRNRKRVAGSTSTFYAAAAFTRDRALRSFSRYENLARNELASKRRGVNDLRGRHARIATEIGYDQKLNRFRDAIHMNKNVTSAIVRHSVLGNTLDASGSIDGVCGAGTWTEDGPTDLSRVVEALKHCVRDWSIDALEERTHVFMPILSVLNQVPRQQRKNTKVLVPGAGLCRLAWEIARMGFDVTANEVSSYMTLPFRMLLDDASTPTTNSHTVCPHFSWFSHTRSNDSLFQSVSFPDILPRVDKDGTVTSAQDIENTLDRELGHFYIPGGKFELVESDFLALSSPNRTDPTDTTPQDVLQINPHSVVPVQPHDRGYDFIVTLFFIDTASNILAYLDQIHALLRSQRGLAGATDDYPNAIRSAGTWINLGPLLWPLGASLEPSLEEVLAMSERVGFDIIGERSSSSRGQTDTATTNPIETRRTLECQYTANRAGMMKWMYQAEFWVAKRQKD